MSFFSLHLNNYPTIALAFAAIPRGVTSLDLSWNNLGRRTSDELATIFAEIPEGVTSLYLSGNELDRKTGAELALAFAAIPGGVTSLYLSGNFLYRITGAELALAFAAIPGSVTSLDLSGNYLGKRAGAELALAFAAIPRGVTSLNLRENILSGKTDTELAEIFEALPPGVTVCFKGDGLFKNKTHEEKDALLVKLRQASLRKDNTRINLDLSGNGESDALRSLGPLSCLARKPVGDNRHYIDASVICYILSFLLPKHTSYYHIHRVFLRAVNIVNLQSSIDNTQNIGHRISLGFFNQSQASSDLLLINNAEESSNSGSGPQSG